FFRRPTVGPFFTPPSPFKIKHSDSPIFQAKLFLGVRRMNNGISSYRQT
ncbi:hypothetical protein HMPREF1556_01553, partial [Porphyromonas sp. oral taxon 278 str. W7784]